MSGTVVVNWQAREYRLAQKCPRHNPVPPSNARLECPPGLCHRDISQPQIQVLECAQSNSKSHFLSHFLVFQMPNNVLVWDAAAGSTHSLLVADGNSFQPDVYYLGKQPRYANKSGNSYMWNREISQEKIQKFVEYSHMLNRS